MPDSVMIDPRNLVNVIEEEEEVLTTKYSKHTKQDKRNSLAE